MNRIITRFFITATIFFIITAIAAQDKGESTFKQICGACHTVGKGRLVGPDLINVNQRHPEDWLMKFVKSSQSVIKSGDKYADSLFQAFNQVPMPDQPTLTDDQIKEVFAYIKNNSNAMSATSAIPKADNPSPAISGDQQRGQDLFVGTVRLNGNGPTCNSCHNVNLEGLISGGAMAKDLTNAASRITVDGIKGVLAGLPFPAMKQAYGNNTLTEKEINDLAAFLKHTDEVAATQKAGNAGNLMLLGGGGGIVCLLILFLFFWYRRKKQEVNHSIYERQIKSY